MESNVSCDVDTARKLAAQPAPGAAHGWWIVLLLLSCTLASTLGYFVKSLLDRNEARFSALQREIVQLREETDSYARKDGLQRCYEHLEDRVKQVQASASAAATATATATATAAATAQIEPLLQTAQKGSRELATELGRLRERLATFETRPSPPVATTPVIIESGPERE